MLAYYLEDYTEKITRYEAEDSESAWTYTQVTAAHRWCFARVAWSSPCPTLANPFALSTRVSSYLLVPGIQWVASAATIFRVIARNPLVAVCVLLVGLSCLREHAHPLTLLVAFGLVLYRLSRGSAVSLRIPAECCSVNDPAETLFCSDYPVLLGAVHFPQKVVWPFPPCSWWLSIVPLLLDHRFPLPFVTYLISAAGLYPHSSRALLSGIWHLPRSCWCSRLQVCTHSLSPSCALTVPWVLLVLQCTPQTPSICVALSSSGHPEAHP